MVASLGHRPPNHRRPGKIQLFVTRFPCRKSRLRVGSMVSSSRTIPVINPAGWFGKCWLFEIGGSYSPLFLIVEADTVSDAIDELAESEFGHNIIVEYPELGDHDPDDLHYGPAGQMIDLDHLMVHGTSGRKTPFPCRYHGENLPKEGVSPTDYWQLDEGHWFLPIDRHR